MKPYTVEPANPEVARLMKESEPATYTEPKPDVNWFNRSLDFIVGALVLAVGIPILGIVIIFLWAAFITLVQEAFFR